MTKEALKLALAALSSGVDMQIGRVVWTEYDSSSVQEAITAIKEALAKPEAVHITWNSDGVRTVNGVPDYTPPAAQQERSDTRPCRSCDGTGERFTGIDEAPTSICKPCKGTGQIALAEQRKPQTDVIRAAQGVLESTEIAHRPPIGDLLEVGRMVRVRLHALADLHNALAAHGIKENT